MDLYRVGNSHKALTRDNMSVRLFSFSITFSGGPVRSLDAVKAMLPERAVLCFTDGGFGAEGRRGTGVHRQTHAVH